MNMVRCTFYVHTNNCRSVANILYIHIHYIIKTKQNIYFVCGVSSHKCVFKV